MISAIQLQNMPAKLKDFPDPEGRFKLKECINLGIYGKSVNAEDTETNKDITIKIQTINDDNERYLVEEYRIVKEFSNNLNIVDFLGAFRKSNELWLVFEKCDGGPVLNLVNNLLARHRSMTEDHIAFILKETVKALIYLHKKHVIHRDLKATNILLTKNGEIKLTGFHASKILGSTLGKSDTSLGSPCWMAPEAVTASEENDYDNRVDVWALGMTAIELGDGKTPFCNMHPTRVLFQIVRNPPPTLYRMSNWCEHYNDFISECLIKNPEHRPYMEEVIEHPFLAEVPENNYHLSLELKSLMNFTERHTVDKPKPETFVKGNCIKTNVTFEPMNVEDLAAMENITEKSVIVELQKRVLHKNYQTFIGDILVSLNSKREDNNEDAIFHKKYMFKSRSDNQPHIFAIADAAYQNALHHDMTQKIILTGESGSGKTTNYLQLMNHLLLLGSKTNISTARLMNGVSLIHSLTHASTPLNIYSTRCIMQTEVSYGATGKTTGALFKLYHLEKSRISSVDMTQANFHFLYYVYDGLHQEGKLENYYLCSKRNYRYLRIVEESTNKPRNDVENNVVKFKQIRSIFKEFEFDKEQEHTLFTLVAAILILGEIRFREGNGGYAEIINIEAAETAAKLLNTDAKKFCWTLTKYCTTKNGSVISKKNTCDEARDSRDVLANNLYLRLVDYVVAWINYKLALGKVIFGEKYRIRVFDYYGFECFKRNDLTQLFVNTLNEEIQHNYIQRIFAWEAQDMVEEELNYKTTTYYNNQSVLDQLLNKSAGLLSIIDQASKMEYSGKYITEFVKTQEKSHITYENQYEFSVAHYTGRVTYNAKEMPDKNRDFLPPEMIHTFQQSMNDIIKTMFSNNINKFGCINFDFHVDGNPENAKYSGHQRKKKTSLFQYSQTSKVRTISSVFRSISLDILSDLSVGAGSGGTQYVRCIKTNLDIKSNKFHKELVRQQVRALALVETAKARKYGYPHRIRFPEFLRRYQFLAYDFGENVDITRDNCRLLLVRLKMEGWAIGNSRVFLTYFNEEYLSRLYETQVKKIIKIQSIMRAFLTKCHMKKKAKMHARRLSIKLSEEIPMTEDEAASVIQKAYRGRILKRHSLSVDKLEDLNDPMKRFIRPFAKKWKYNSLFHVLMQYKALKYQDLFNFSQQVHLFNQNAMFNVQSLNNEIDISAINESAQVDAWLGTKKPTVTKINFLLHEVPFYDTSAMMHNSNNVNRGLYHETDETWDRPYQWRRQITFDCCDDNAETKTNNLTNLPFHRNPEEELKIMEEKPDDEDEIVNENKRVISNKNPNVVKKHVKKPTVEASASQTRPVFGENKLRKTAYNQEEKVLNNCEHTKPANKDFDYIKAPSRPKPNVDPLSELKQLVRKNSDSEDAPPFNFQGMLRKTNFQRDSVRRDSIKNIMEGVRRFSLKIKNPSKNNEDVNESNKCEEGKHISEELCPGVVVNGMEFDL